jgi:hypothetical protein
MKWVYTLGAGLLVLLLAAQLIPADTTNPPVASAMELPGGETGQLLRAACMDCHSNETVWPWYSRVAPMKFFIASHVVEGREHLNLSTWGETSLRDRDHALEEIVEVLEENEMPLASYTILHGDARLDEAGKRLLIEWARAERQKLREAGGPSSGGGESEGRSEAEGDDGH